MPRPVAPAHDPSQLTLFSVSAEVVPLGDGTWRVVPGKPQEKIKVRQAVKLLGVSASVVRRLYHAGEIAGEQPAPRVLWLFAASVEAHRRRTRDPEHWTAARRQKMRGRNESCAS